MPHELPAFAEVAPGDTNILCPNVGKSGGVPSFEEGEQFIRPEANRFGHPLHQPAKPKDASMALAVAYRLRC
jgi:hypothetical protein